MNEILTQFFKELAQYVPSYRHLQGVLPKKQPLNDLIKKIKSMITNQSHKTGKKPAQVIADIKLANGQKRPSEQVQELCTIFGISYPKCTTYRDTLASSFNVTVKDDLTSNTGFEKFANTNNSSDTNNSSVATKSVAETANHQENFLQKDEPQKQFEFKLKDDGRLSYGIFQTQCTELELIKSGCFYIALINVIIYWVNEYGFTLGPNSPLKQFLTNNKINTNHDKFYSAVTIWSDEANAKGYLKGASVEQQQNLITYLADRTITYERKPFKQFFALQTNQNQVIVAELGVTDDEGSHFVLMQDRVTMLHDPFKEGSTSGYQTKERGGYIKSYRIFSHS